MGAILLENVAIPCLNHKFYFKKSRAKDITTTRAYFSLKFPWCFLQETGVQQNWEASWRSVPGLGGAIRFVSAFRV